MVRMQPRPPLPLMHLSASVPVPPPSGANSRMKPPVCPNIRSCGASASLAERATSSTARLNLLLSCFRLAVWLLSRTVTSPCRPHPPPTARCGPRGQCGRFTHLHDPVTGLLWPPAAKKGLQGGYDCLGVRRCVGMLDHDGVFSSSGDQSEAATQMSAFTSSCKKHIVELK